MLQKIENFDTWLLLKINQAHTQFLDWLMWQFSGNLIWLPLYFVIVYLFWKKFKQKGIIYILIAIIAVGIADFTSVHLFKFQFQRLRPCHNPELQQFIHLVNNYCGGKYGFISSHASNVGALATFVALSLRHKITTILVFLWAFLVGLSRVYLGVHYPFDVICGWIWGTLIGLTSWLIITKLYKKFSATQ